MKVLIQEKEGEGLLGLLGKRVTIYCGVYIYSGLLVGVNDSCVKLSEAELVLETGAFSDKKWRTVEKFPNDWYVQTSAIESFGILK